MTLVSKRPQLVFYVSLQGKWLMPFRLNQFTLLNITARTLYEWMDFKHQNIFNTHHGLVDDYCCFNILDCFPDVPAVSSILHSISQVSAPFFDTHTDASTLSVTPPEFGAYRDAPSISGTRRLGSRPICCTTYMLLAPVIGHPPLQVSRIGAAFIGVGASLEDHVRMFLLKKSRQAWPCSFLGCEVRHKRLWSFYIWINNSKPYNFPIILLFCFFIFSILINLRFEALWIGEWSIYNLSKYVLVKLGYWQSFWTSCNV